MAEQQFEMNNQGPKKNRRIKWGAVLTIPWTVTLIWLKTAQAQPPMTNSTFDTVVALKPSNLNIWQNGIGEGFKSGIQSVGFSTGAGCELEIFGSRQNHGLALAGLSYRYTLGSVKGEGHRYRGNRELRDDLFSGGQFSPRKDWPADLTPRLRYSFATGNRRISYVNGGTEVTATGMGPPDLSPTFEFNLQDATGVSWFIGDNVAPGVETRYLRLSCTGMDSPNLGLNNVNRMPGISWFSDDTE